MLNSVFIFDQVLSVWGLLSLSIDVFDASDLSKRNFFTL